VGTSIKPDQAVGVHMQVKFVDAGTSTRCLIAGNPDAYPIMMLHGYGGTADIWIRNIDALADRFYVIAVDMLGSGFTPPNEAFGGPRQAAIVRQLHQLADALGLGKFCAMGTSYGSMIASLLYFDMPDRVDRLVLNGSANVFNTDERRADALTKVLENYGPVMDAPSVESCRAVTIKQVYDPSSVPEDMLLTMATAYAQPWMKASWEQGLRDLLDADVHRPYMLRPRLAEFDVETLVVWGRQDPNAVYETAVAGVALMPRARLETFEQCGHKPLFEHFERYNGLIRDFLGTGGG